MALGATPSRVRRNGNEILTYELPERIRQTHVYPLLAPNNSTAVLFASHKTLTISWRGGKRKSKAAVGLEANGVSDSDVIMVDSDGDEPTQPQSEAPVDAMTQEHILEQTTVTFDEAIVDVAIPDIPRRSTGQAVVGVPDICTTKLACVVALKNGKVYLLAPSLSPATAQLTLESCEAVFIHQTQLRHYSATHRVALTLRAFPITTNGNFLEGASWDLVLAHYTSEPVPSLHVARLALDFASLGEIASDRSRMSKHTHYLSNPLVSIAFSPSSVWKTQTQLLLTESLGSVRVCDVAARVPKSRASHSLAIRAPDLASSLTWLASFYAPFADFGSAVARTSACPQRKAILGAAWAMQGRSIVVLLADGMWGLWNLEDASQTGISGGGVTLFSVYGRLAAATSPTSESSTRTASPHAIGARPGNESSLAPMTPNTRKTKQANFFNEPPRSLIKPQLDLKPTIAQGGLNVCAGYTAVGAYAFDTLLLWYQAQVYAIPNLTMFQDKTRQIKSNIRGPLQGADTPALPDLSAGGEAISSVALLPSTINPATIAPQQRLLNNVLVAAEHRHLLYCPPLPSLPARRAAQPSQPQRLLAQRPSHRGAEQTLLARGDLDIGSLDRMLDAMDDAKGPPKLNMLGEPEKPRRVGFAAADH